MSGLKHLIYALGMIAIFIIIKKNDRAIKLSSGTADNYTVITPPILKKVYMLIFAVGMILYGVFLILYIKKISGVTKGHLRFALVFAAIGIIVVFLACKWKVEVFADKMKITPLLGKTVTLEICGLEKAKIGSKGEVTIYYNGKKMTKVDPLSVNYDKLCDSLVKYGKL
ncbi:MAG: hypothetical protein HFH68_17015 [Lachnospiraceae bacterium]|nr:hypothetical protein [Lachnospiraceae bacterium]